MPLVTGDNLNEDGIIKSTADAPPLSVIKSVLVTSKDYRSTFVDTKWSPRTNLLTHIEGASWVVDYYSQVINSDSALSGQSLSTNPVYQSYTLIKDMELKVSSALSNTQDEKTKAMEVRGSALTYPFMIPNEGDMFVADIGEGKLAVFRVIVSVKKSIFNEACYEISYNLDTDGEDKLADLLQKTVKTVYFHKDFLTYGQNPLLVASAKNILLSLSKQYSILADQYFKRFFSNEFKTILLPAQDTSVYDHFLVDYLLSEFSTRDSQEVKYIRKLNVNDDDSMKADSLWKALKYKDVSFMNTAFRRAGLVSVNVFTSDPVLEGIRYTGINKVVYPIDPSLSVDYMQLDRTQVVDSSDLSASPVTNSTNNVMVRAINLRGTEASINSSISLVTKDNFYVLSQDFYNKTTTQSVLEGVVWNYLENKDIDATQLLDTAKAYYNWGILEQFYYIPIILTLIRSVIRGM
jgi:hypothetical protein